MRTAWKETASLLSMNVESEQLDLLYHDTLTGAVLGIGIMAALLFFFRDSVPSARLAAWVAFSVAVYAGTLACCWIYQRSVRVRQRRVWWAKCAVAFCFLLGVANGVSSLAIYLPADIAAESLLHLALAGSTLGALVHLSSFLPALYAYALGMSVVVIPRNLLVGDTLHYVVAFLGMLVFVSVMIGGHTRAKTMAELFRTRNEKRDLADALLRENQAANRAREQAELANKSKSQFFAAANHDLRQPLHALGLFAQTLQESGNKADVPALSRQIMACVDNLGALFDELLDISRLDAGMVQPAPSHFELAQVFHDLTITHRPVAQAKGLVLSIEKTNAVVQTDRMLLLRVLSNLVGNAIRYTPSGTVTVAVEPIGGALAVHVRDTGVGIASQQLPRIFEEFYQVGNTQRDRSKGLGLGLATVKRLSELLGLKVTVESRVGEGSTFSVYVETGSAALVNASTAPQVPALGDDQVLGKRVLVVDDEPQVREGMQQLLTAWGSEVALAANCAEACYWIEQKFVPDFVMADLRMANGETGIQTIGRLRGMLGRDTPAVLISGDTQAEQLLAAKAAGLALLHKPIKPAQLRALLNQVFTSAAAEGKS
jgi:signal transduction histidine kinase/CheY-like chemotaxis protein